MSVFYEEVFEYDVDCDECGKDIDSGMTDFGGSYSSFMACTSCGHVLCDACEGKHYDAVDEEFSKDEIKFFRVCADADKDGKCGCESIHRGYRLHQITIKGIDRFNKEITRCPKCGKEDAWEEMDIMEYIFARTHAKTVKQDENQIQSV